MLPFLEKTQKYFASINPSTADMPTCDDCGIVHGNGPDECSNYMPMMPTHSCCNCSDAVDRCSTCQKRKEREAEKKRKEEVVHFIINQFAAAGE